MKISITGMEGAGKSTVARMLAKNLGFKFLSVGDLRGKMALERGMTIDGLNELGKTDASVHTDADDFARKWGKENDDFVLEARLGFWTVPDSFKIFLKVRAEVASERIFQDQENRPDEKVEESPAAILEKVKKRVEVSRETMRKIYGVDFLEMENFDLILDTSEIPAVEVMEKIREALPS